MGAILDRREMEDGKLSSIAMAEQLLHVRSRWGGTIALDANTVQRSYEENRKPKNIVLKARQMGITTWVAGQFFLKTITHPGTLTVQVAHTQEAAESIFRIVRRFLRCLPQSIRQAALKTAEVSAHRIVFPGMDSEYRVETAGAPNAGRGLTITNLHASEVARWPGDPAEILEGLRAALSPAGELVLESTPMGAAGCFWKEWQEAEKTGTARHFFPWWMEETYVAKAAAEDSLSEDELRLREERHLSLRQIGYRRQMLKNFRGLAKQEYAEDANSCFLASGECLFDTDAIDQRLRDVAEPVETRQRGELRIWLHPQAGRRYLVAVDPAGGGTDGDYAVAQVIDLGTALQCAELRGHRTPLELAEESAALATEYHGALLAVERNNHGSGVLAYLRGVCRYERLYQQGGQDGWPTTAVTRPGMLGRVGSALVETPTLFQSERLLHECRSFVRHANGQSAAQAGEHDDCVMAMAIALAVREEELAGLQ
ncbi:MAG TPA: hypothetical protein VMD25_02985 [Acidobacteriaceae bacterium]|nr:hypothetical protein [Acidobacteriaceae bacterium]